MYRGKRHEYGEEEMNSSASCLRSKSRSNAIRVAHEGKHEDYLSSEAIQSKSFKLS